MKRWRIGLLLSFVVFLWGQTATFKTALIDIENSHKNGAELTKQLVDAMMPLADSDRVPSREGVEDFTREFTVAMAGRKLTDAQRTGIRNVITQVMKGSTTNLKSSSQLLDALDGLDIDSLEMLDITKKFIAIGEDVRGPDDFRLSKLQ